MAGEVERYQDALGKYENAQASALKVVATIRRMNDCLSPSNFPSLLGWSFGISDQIQPGQRFDPKAKMDLGDWPDRDELKARFRDWHSAWVDLQGAWADLPDARRRGFNAPPDRMRITY